MIFAAGLGTRLKSYTKNNPKALLEINNKPLLRYVIDNLSNYNFSKIIINVHHFSEQIIKYLDSIDYPNIEIIISDESNLLLDTGGGLKFASRHFKNADNILLHNVDVISNINIEKLWETHVKSDNIATIAVKNRETSRYFLFNDNYLLRGWEDRKTGKKILCSNENLNAFAFSGIHVVSGKIFKLFPIREKFSITDFYLQICSQKNIYGYVHNDDLWVDVGKPENISAAEKILK